MSSISTHLPRSTSLRLPPLRLDLSFKFINGRLISKLFNYTPIFRLNTRGDSSTVVQNKSRFITSHTQLHQSDLFFLDSLAVGIRSSLLSRNRSPPLAAIIDEIPVHISIDQIQPSLLHFLQFLLLRFRGRITRVKHPNFGIWQVVVLYQYLSILTR